MTRTNRECITFLFAQVADTNSIQERICTLSAGAGSTVIVYVPATDETRV